MHRAKVGFVLVALVCGWAKGEPGPGTPGTVQPARHGAVHPASPFTEGIKVAESQYALGSGASPTSFNFARLRELWVRVQLAAMPRTAELTLTLVDPSGVVAYEASVHYSRARMQEIEVPNAGHRVTVFPAQQVRGGFALDYGMPVSTSSITRYLTNGDWRLEAAVDGTARFSKILSVQNAF
jgi:hypothetical protein